MILTYKDPKKKKLQMLEIIAMILLLPPGLYYAYGAYTDWKVFKEAEAIYKEASDLLHAGRYDEGIPKAEEALAIYPTYYGPWEDLATAHHMMGNHELEVATYVRAIAVLPESGSLHRGLATSYHEVGQHEKELEHAKKATTLVTTDPVFTNRILMRAQKEASGEVSTDVIERPDAGHFKKPEEAHDHGDGHDHSHEAGNDEH